MKGERKNKSESQFQYKVVYAGVHEVPHMDNFLNNYGEQGWELVHILEGKFITDPTITCNYKFIFKKELP